jgi:hypothetical protein
MHRHYPPPPAYQDISHFRAPYKNVWSMGADAPPSPGPGGSLTPPGGDTAAFQALYDVKDGVHIFKPEVRNQILALLGLRRVVFVGGPNERVNTVPYTAEEIEAMKTPEGQALFAPMQASKWVAERVAEGKAVFAPAWMLMPDDATSTKELAAIPAKDTDRVKEAASTPYVGILGGYSPGFFAGLSTANLYIGVAALALVGGGYWLYQRDKKGVSPIY